jgi:hypothetical protein
MVVCVCASICVFRPSSTHFSMAWMNKKKQSDKFLYILGIRAAQFEHIPFVYPRGNTVDFGCIWRQLWNTQNSSRTNFEQNKNSFRISLFISRQKVIEPHDVCCDCEKCLVYNKKKIVYDIHVSVLMPIKHFHLSSSCYISLSSQDLIMTASYLNRN